MYHFLIILSFQNLFDVWGHFLYLWGFVQKQGNTPPDNIPSSFILTSSLVHLLCIHTCAGIISSSSYHFGTYFQMLGSFLRIWIDDPWYRPLHAITVHRRGIDHWDGCITDYTSKPTLFSPNFISWWDDLCHYSLPLSKSKLLYIDPSGHRSLIFINYTSTPLYSRELTNNEKR